MRKQVPIKLKGSSKWDVRSQFASLCYKIEDGKLRVLMITSRGTGRWIIPKGWPKDGHTPVEAAAEEAWEEAGVKGKPDDVCLGLFSYRKEVGDEAGMPCVAMVYPLKVTKIAKSYPESKQRQRKWMSRKKAAALVTEPELAQIIRSFDPRQGR